MKKLLLLSALCLMVSGQVLGLSHDIAHAQGDHTELCGVFKTDNQTTLVHSLDQAVSIGLFSTLIQSQQTGHIHSFSGMLWSGRAPPL